LELEAEKEALKAAPWARRSWRSVWLKGPSTSPPTWDLEVIRTDAQFSVSRFAELIGVPHRTYTWRLARHRAGDPVGWGCGWRR
jgi:hypothetical protein